MFLECAMARYERDCGRLLHNWTIVCPMDRREELKTFILSLEKLVNMPEMLQWQS